MSYQYDNRNTYYPECHNRVPPLYQSPQDNQRYYNQNVPFNQTLYHHHIPQYRENYRHTRNRKQNQAQAQYTPNIYYRDMQHKKQNYHRYNQNQHYPNRHTTQKHNEIPDRYIRYGDSFNSGTHIDTEHQGQETDQQQMYSMKQIQQYLTNQQYQNQRRNTNSYTHTMYNQQMNYAQQDKNETELDEEFYKNIRVNMVFPRFNDEPTPQNPPDKYHPENSNGSSQL